MKSKWGVLVWVVWFIVSALCVLDALLCPVVTGMTG